MTQQVATRAPFATTSDGWQAPVSASYGSRQQDGAPARHQKERIAARNYIQWGFDPRPSNSSTPALHVDARVFNGFDYPGSKMQVQSELGEYSTSQSPHSIYPQASRGIPGGSQPKWSFERMPSLLAHPLQRDVCKRSCAGIPPAAVKRPESHDSSQFTRTESISRDPLPRSGTQGNARTNSLKHSQQLRRQSSAPGRSSSSIGFRQAPFGRLHHLVGISWDNAAVTAGDAYRGGDGDMMGF